MKVKEYLEIDVKKMNRKVKEKFERTRNVDNKDKLKKYILQGERDVRYFDSNLSKSLERQQKNLST